MRNWIKFQMLAMDRGWEVETDFVNGKCIVKFEGKEVQFNPIILNVYETNYVVDKVEKEFDSLNEKIVKHKKVKKSKRCVMVVFDEYHEYE